MRSTTMRRFLTNTPSRGVCVTVLAAVIGLTGASAHAQTHKKKPAAGAPAAGAPPAKPSPVDMDADSPAPAPALPEPADIIERVGKYNEEHVAKFNNKEQQEIYWQLNYLLGRYRYRNGQFPEGLALLDKVDRRSKYYVQAQFFGGVTNVQM